MWASRTRLRLDAGRRSLTLLHVAEAILFAWEDTGANFVTIAARGGHTFFEKLGVSLHELRLQVGRQAEQVVADQHLSVAVGARADANGRDVDLFGDPLGEVGRDAFEHQGVRARFGDRFRVGQYACAAPPSVLPCTRKPPIACTLWGVRPTCAMTGMPA